MLRLGSLLLPLLAAVVGLRAAPLPQPPERYVSDQADLLSPATEADLNSRLDAFERDTSSQILVATFPQVPDDYAMEDFTQRTAESWGVGQSEDDNGAVLFIFRDDRKIRIEVGYGLEGAIPDATAKTILDREITPAFRGGNFDAGVTRGVDAMFAAARGEYQGTGRTNADRVDAPGGASFISLLFTIFIVFMVIQTLSRAGGRTYDARGRRRGGGFFFPIGSGGSRRRGGGFGGGGFGGGGFGGGGGGFGGGGASGGW